MNILSGNIKAKVEREYIFKPTTGNHSSPDHSPPSNAEINKAWSYTSAPPIHLHSSVLG
jgi:hypothetical protein